MRGTIATASGAPPQLLPPVPRPAPPGPAVGGFCDRAVSRDRTARHGDAAAAHRARPAAARRRARRRSPVGQRAFGTGDGHSPAGPGEIRADRRSVSRARRVARRNRAGRPTAGQSSGRPSRLTRGAGAERPRRRTRPQRRRRTRTRRPVRRTDRASATGSGFGGTGCAGAGQFADDSCN